MLPDFSVKNKGQNTVSRFCPLSAECFFSLTVNDQSSKQLIM